jgi:outer membrane protein TolC
VDNVQVLIQAERIPKSEINQATANLAKRTADRIAAEQNLIRAQQELAVSIGLDVAQMWHVSFSLEDFPQPDLQRLPVLNAEVIAEHVQRALSRRADYLATQRRVEESNVLLAAARNALKPQLDLNFNTGVSGLSEGTAPAQFLNSPYRSIQGLDATAGITYNYPVRNNVAIGQMRQAQGALTQAQLRAADVRRRISSSTITSLNAVHNSAMQLDKARESVRFFEAALQGEREKFSLEFASLVDVLTIEDRLTTAMTDQVSAELGYALALTQLRSATGTIVDPYEEVHSVDRSLFFNMP